MKKESALNNLLISYPCPIDWDNMDGNERKRFCSQCSLNVYNISDMTEEEAEDFLIENEGGCVKFYLREDGTIKTKSCSQFLEKARHRISGVKKSVAVFIMIVISFLTGETKVSSALDAKDYVKSLWSKNVRKFDLHKLDRVMGRPSKSEIRKVIDDIAPRISFSGSRLDQPDAIKQFVADIERTNTIDPKYVSKLETYSKETENEDLYFQVMLLKALLADENPTLEKSTKQKAITEFEKIRFKMLKKLVNEAKSTVDEGRNQYPIFRLEEFSKIAFSGQTFLAKDYSRPCNMKVWKTPSTLPYDRCKNLSFLIATELMIDTVISIFEKVEQTDSADRIDKISRQIRFARLNRTYETTGDKALLSKINAIQTELVLLQTIHGYPSCYLAKYIGYDIEDDGDYSYHFSIVRKFKPVKKVAGKTIEGPEFVFTDSQEFRKSEDKNDPYQLSRFRDTLVDKGTEFIVLSGSGSTTSGIVPFCSAMLATEGMEELAVKNRSKLSGLN